MADPLETPIFVTDEDEDDKDESPWSWEPGWWFAGVYARALVRELPPGTIVEGEPDEHGMITGPDGGTAFGIGDFGSFNMNF
jgi:hypothetical protein